MYKKWTALVLSCVLVLGCFAGCSQIESLLGKTQVDTSTSGTDGGTAGDTSAQVATGQVSYKKVFTESKVAELPLFATDFDNIFFTMATDGTVNFFTLADGALTARAEDGAYSCSVRCSGQDIPVTIHYVVENGQTNGYGLFTSASDPTVMLFDYAFFKLCELPAAFREEGELLLLIDTDKTRFYKEKRYSEEFYFDTDDYETDYFLSEDQRASGMDGLKTVDYKMFTDEILAQPYDTFYFFTSRAYAADAVKLVDIYTSGGYYTNVDNIRVIRNMLGMYFYRTDAGVYYYSAEGDGFVLYLYDGANYTNIRTFAGDYNTDYLRSGTALLQISTGVIYDIATATEYTIDYAAMGSGFVPINFVMNGRYACVTGDNADGDLLIGVLDTQGELVTVDDFTNRNLLRFHITDDGTLLISVCYESDYTAYQLLKKFGA